MAGRIRAGVFATALIGLPVYVVFGAGPGEAVAVTGTVRFEGTRPAAETLDMSRDAYCVQANQGETATRRRVEVGDGGGLAHVTVYVKEGPISRGGAVPPDPVVLDQQNCRYIPRAIAARVGQTVRIRNSDRTLHNVHVKPTQNREFNVGQPIQGMESPRSFAVPEVGIPVTCDIHGWMSSTIAVFDHDHFAVTAGNGAFDLGQLPPGDYVIEAWHETLGTQQQNVTVTAGAAPAITFTFASS